MAWFAPSEDGFEARSREPLDALGIPVEWLSPAEAPASTPPCSTDDLAGVLYEPAAGVLHARRATQLLVATRSPRSPARGGRAYCRPTRPRRTPWSGPAVPGCRCSSRSRCDPDLAPRRVLLRRRRVVAWHCRASATTTRGSTATATSTGLGVKVASDADGPEIDPDTAERYPTRVGARRAPTRPAASPASPARRSSGPACASTTNTDAHFLVGRHPERTRVARRRRLRPRLQARPRPRRVRRRLHRGPARAGAVPRARRPDRRRLLRTRGHL